MTKNKFFIILALIGFCLALLSGLLLTVGKTAGQFFFGRSFAEGQLKAYVATVQRQEINGVTCQSRDTDANGYVSCDYTTKTDPGRVQTIECSAWGISGFLNRGCKARLPGLPSSR